MNMNNIIHVCNECSDKRRETFQRRMTQDAWEKIKNLVLNKNAVYMKFPLTNEIIQYYNEEIHRNYYYATYSKEYKGDVEHIWIMCGDVDMEARTVCGILSNEPYKIKKVKEDDIIIVDFKNIEDIHSESF